ncbi:uncharacterized protein LOC127240507 [Andrographis paniculata]|uniref:uncharacterized protein LOC127240507 n=1 Tax=Andrographis paniculata TaxID=175694 RepID=UPI0021E9A730|nr:uncharacterized protein LOC127240507 [Andrographis paniculata]
MVSSGCLPHAHAHARAAPPCVPFPCPPSSAPLFQPLFLPPKPLLVFETYPISTITSRTRATLDPIPAAGPSLLVQGPNRGPNQGVDECVRLLKDAAKTRKVPPGDILRAFSVIEKAKADPSGFLRTLGGTKSPGRTWMLIFTAKKKLDDGNYFPVTAVQRFDAAGKRIENGVYLGPLGSLTFEGRFSWNKRILAFIFERIRVKAGPLGPFEYCFKGKDDEREPGNRDPFFTWFYVDEEIAVARGRSGGTAFWVRCHRVASSS